MANQKLGGNLSDTMEMGMSVTEAADRYSDVPLTADETVLMRLMKRQVEAGHFDDRGYYYAPSGSGRATAQPQVAAPAAAAPAAPPASAPSPAPAATGAPTLITAAGSNAPLLSLTKVQPGDLITAGFVNEMIDALLALDARLRTLEVRPVITGIAASGSGSTVGPAAGTGTATGGTTTGGGTAPAPDRFDIASATLNATAKQNTLTLTIKGVGLLPRKLRGIVLGGLEIDMDRIRGNDETITTLLTEDDLDAIAEGAKGGKDLPGFDKPIKGIARNTLAVIAINVDGDRETAPVTLGNGRNAVLTRLRTMLDG